MSIRGPRAPRLVLSLMLAAPVAVWAGLGLGFDPVAWEATRPLVHRDGGHVGSARCQSCHPEQHASWRRTFHSTMTQRPTPATVRGRFDGEAVRYAGQQARPFRHEDGRFFMEVPDGRGGSRTAEVAMAVGSRRYQQYFEREARGEGFALVRLPFLWHIEQERWMHLNTVFLTPDDPDWGVHRSEWNENCIFCHNTGPEPRMLNYRDPSRVIEERFDSKVSELGIACEACHGPGAAHVAQGGAPWQRLAAYRRAEGEGLAIVHPARLDKERSVAVCGQCHGARLPEPLSRVSAWLTTGPTFRAGELLSEHVAPITRDTAAAGGDPDLFRLRFWADGTPRLTAYELQGTTASACYLRGEMTCLSCHAMHRGDPKGQLRPELTPREMCTGCHDAIGRDVPGHTKHAGASSGSECVACHMPRIVYGVTAIHRSHRIENPDAGRDAAAGRPHACTLCHLDRTLLWSATETARLWGRPAATPGRRLDGAPLDVPDAVASLHAGDAAMRAVYASAMGRATGAIPSARRGFLRAHLALALGDAYPTVRRTALQSLAALDRELPCGGVAELSRVDLDAGPDARRDAVMGALRGLEACGPALAPPSADQLLEPGGSPRIDAAVALMNLQEGRVIAIGE